MGRPSHPLHSQAVFNHAQPPARPWAPNAGYDRGPKGSRCVCNGCFIGDGRAGGQCSLPAPGHGNVVVPLHHAAQLDTTIGGQPVSFPAHVVDVQQYAFFTDGDYGGAVGREKDCAALGNGWHLVSFHSSFQEASVSSWLLSNGFMTVSSRCLPVGRR